MQSGISASEALHSAFQAFTANPKLFALPVSISSETLIPLDSIPFNAIPHADFYASLPLLQTHLSPRIPIYLILRRDPNPEAAQNSLIAVTYIPSVAPVRSKTLFASTRATLVRELGLEKFGGGQLFCTEASEVYEEQEWREREGTADGSTAVEKPLTTEERELQGVKRAEDEERHGTQGRNTGMGGTGGSGSVGVVMPTEDAAKEALRSLGQEVGTERTGAVQLYIDIPTETLKLSFSETDVSPSSLSSKISDSEPRYTFYHYPGSTSIIFIYTCPSTSSIRQRMLYASSRRSALQLAEMEGLEVAKRVEASTPDEITEERLREEVNPSQETGTKQAFARPKRPGKR